mmetsp:Transcript_2547/g.4316  ORF Transcript_2547/g.4316 Transcript_2547/m.4316 type:complete len:173 (-) Transcript_2547:464-982(-)|eukprot:CAMPEP_0119101926 /NCGR_PEP_ID=MMETSP1180-20130426/825_1 /TAXON_ID=3052 ORGANISM="Chlamydomonas cf sp, Strain CCMP681" /NCGR_SAMPLE_ID=MMETSP1180 /ASSEMBLY_ACC=CAM_ASM_000741 /LENGTH=172 /DNA_ID=CAMNT_0007086111 /DNA_START=80 /DNA_END=598 /DNA_ORIENTATION=+
MADEEQIVELYQYDLTQGMAKALSPMLLGVDHAIEGVWHTSIVIHGIELFFGQGVQQTRPGTTPFGQPLHKHVLGVSQVPKMLVLDMVTELGSTRFKPTDYNLFHNNCNHFSHALAELLCGQGVPTEILTQHEVLQRSPMGAMLMPMIQQMEGQMRTATATGFSAGQPAPGN